MDAISQCEIKADEGGLPEIKAPWSVVFRREIFPPWQISVTDSVSINLTYIQIIKGIAIGDYKCSQVIYLFYVYNYIIFSQFL